MRDFTIDEMADMSSLCKDMDKEQDTKIQESLGSMFADFMKSIFLWPTLEEGKQAGLH